MRRPRSTVCVVSQHPYQYSLISQRCFCPRQDSRSWTSGSRRCCRCRGRVGVWIALAMLLGCCAATDAYLVLPRTSTPAIDVEDSRSDDRLSRTSLLLPRPASSNRDNRDDTDLFVNEDFNEGYNVRHHHRHSRSASETSDRLSTYNTRRRRHRRRSMLNIIILYCYCRGIPCRKQLFDQ